MRKPLENEAQNSSGVQKQTATNSRLLANFATGDAGKGSFLEFKALQRGRCFFSYIHPNATTHGPPTSSARPGQPRELFADHQRFPANQVRGATASGFFKFNLGLHARIVNGAGRKSRGEGRPLLLPRAVLNELGLSLKIQQVDCQAGGKWSLVKSENSYLES